MHIQRIALLRHGVQPPGLSRPSPDGMPPIDVDIYRRPAISRGPARLRGAGAGGDDRSCLRHAQGAHMGGRPLRLPHRAPLLVRSRLERAG
jgi:hypothetical protein